MGKLLALTLVCTLVAAVLFQPLLMGRPREITTPDIGRLSCRKNRSRRKVKGRKAPPPVMVAAQPTVAAPAIDVAGNDRSVLAGLAFWGRNMAPIRAKGWIWPGFDYSDAEWKRLLTLAETVSFNAFVGFQLRPPCW